MSFWLVPMMLIFQSTLPARGATRRHRQHIATCTISIHAPRTGSDMKPTGRAARASSFQSTLPARGATEIQQGTNEVLDISIHAPRTGSDVAKGRKRPRKGKISIHAPRTGSDPPTPGGSPERPDFNPRSPHGERLYTRAARHEKAAISIHAPRTGSDNCTAPGLPRAGTFQSTLPARGATSSRARCPAERRFQSTLPARGATPREGANEAAEWHFNPRSPHGERRARAQRTPTGADFNPRSPHGERLRKVTILSIRIIGFAQKVYHKTVLLRISLAENAVILPEKPRNPVRTSLQKAGGLRFARAIRAARPYSISSPSGA